MQDVFWRTVLTVGTTVFLAELGDKTQLATVMFAAGKETSKWAVFLGSAVALVCASAIGVAVGAQLEKVISPELLRRIAGAGFVVIGVWTFFSK